MKIGLDVDGVIIDTIPLFRTYEALFDVDILKGNNLVKSDEVNFQDRYAWSDDTKDNFYNEYAYSISKNSGLMPGFKEVYNKLKKEHDFVIITSRDKILMDIALDTLSKNGIDISNYYYDIKDKASVCKSEGVDIMIDDNYDIVNSLYNCGISVLYFRGAGIKKFDNSFNIVEVNNWGDIYRYLRK